MPTGRAVIADNEPGPGDRCHGHRGALGCRHGDTVLVPRSCATGKGSTMDCSKHKGHKRYVGGIMDGEIAHLRSATSTDYPRTFGTLLRHGVRSWYEIDEEASEGTEVVYRCIGVSKEFPQRPA